MQDATLLSPKISPLRSRDDLYALIELLPNERLSEVANFIEFLLLKQLDVDTMSELEDVALAKAIDEGRTGEAVSRAEIFAALDATE